MFPRFQQINSAPFGTSSTRVLNARIRPLRLTAIAVLLLTGCTQGPDLATVTGTVTFDGKPIDRAVVIFQPPTGRPAAGRTDAEGRYTLNYTTERDGAIPGRSQVFITTQLEDDNGNVVRREFLPRKYHRNSELFAVVETRKANIFDFHLTSE